LFEREIGLRRELDEAQRSRLMEIAQRCPVHLMLERGADVRTIQAQPEAATDGESSLHVRHMSEARDDGSS
jgi:putative redox protein